MLAFKILLILLEVVLSILLVLVILLQRSKGEGLGLAFGAEMGESIFGARASSALVKITIWLGAIFVINTIILAYIYTKSNSSSLLGARHAPPIEQPASLPAGQTLPAEPISATPISATPTPVPAAPVAAPPTPQAPAPAPQETAPQAPAAK
jgi:preprotein translocase subunit SecG